MIYLIIKNTNKYNMYMVDVNTKKYNIKCTSNWENITILGQTILDVRGERFNVT